MKTIKIISITLLVFSLNSCRKDYLFVAPVIPGLSFSNDVLPIINTHGCSGGGSCHGIGANNPELTPENAYNSLITGTSSSGGLYIDTITPSSSVFYQSISNQNFSPFQMPSGTKLNVNEQAKILEWITQGAKP